MEEFVIESEVIVSGIKTVTKKSGIDKGMILCINKVEKLVFVCNSFKTHHGYRVNVSVIKSVHKDYRKGQSWDFNIPLHQTIEEYFGNYIIN